MIASRYTYPIAWANAEMVEHRLTQSHLPLGSNRKLDPHVVYPAKACTIGSEGKAFRTLLQAAGK